MVRHEARFQRFAWILFLLLGVRPAGAQVPDRSRRSDVLEVEWRVMDRLEGIYGSGDWSAVERDLADHPDDPGNPNVVLIALSLSNVELNRYERDHDTTDWVHAYDRLEWTLRNHRVWGGRWLTAPVLAYLDLTVYRLVRESPRAAEFSALVGRIWDDAMEITRLEARGRLTALLPYSPYDSAATGDSKAEEDAWEAALLSVAANFLPDDPDAGRWEAKARELAYDAITSSADPPYGNVKVSTVPEDFALANHGFFPNPTYMASTIVLLQTGALPYRLTGRPIPSEFQHNVDRLYRAYRRLVRDDLTWSVPSDPDGDATLFPFAFDEGFERLVATEKEAQGNLWGILGKGGFEPGDRLWAAVLDAKVVLFYMVGSYLWHAPVGVDSAIVSAR
jgi:hypothetical protein